LEADPKLRGYHINALYSPLGWTSWAQCAAEWLALQGNPVQLKTFVNTILAETWEDTGAGAESNTILDRRESYAAQVPAGVGILTASIDSQADRLEVAVKGYGAGEQSWLIAYVIFRGDPAKDAVWYEVDEFLQRSFVHESGRKLRIECVTVDSGGRHSEQVYRFCKARFGRRVFAIRGGGSRGEPLVGRPTTNNAYRAQLFTLCVDTGKEIVYGRLAIASPGPGYMHMPEFVDAEYAAQLAAEKGVWKYVRGRGYLRRWIQTRERNEALDLEVYCLAGLYILGPVVIGNLARRAAKFAAPLTAAEYEQYQNHSLLGARLFGERSQIEKQSLLVLLQHHERADGSGFP
ncbi:MAG: terminase gpA endonuclease subunit, partial [bacterium]